VSELVGVVGALALVLTTVEQLPQAAKVLRARGRTEGVSALAWAVILTTQVVWASWAVRRGDWWLAAAVVRPERRLGDAAGRCHSCWCVAVHGAP